MLDTILDALTLVTALSCGLIAGVLFAFSTFIMKALDRRPANEAIAVMQSINVVIVNSLFLAVFLGTAVACIVIIISALARWQNPGAIWAAVGCGLYLVGTILVTAVWNVPMNNALAAVAPSQADAAQLWASYLVSWTAWNHIRTLAALAAAASLTIALSLGG